MDGILDFPYPTGAARAMIAPKAGAALLPWEANPHRLWSLWDMIRIMLEKHLLVGMNIQLTEHTLLLLGLAPSQPSAKDGHRTIELPDEATKEEIENTLNGMLALCNELRLVVTKELIENALKYEIPETSAEFRILARALFTEVEKKLFLYVPSERAPYWEKDDILSDKTKDAFPNAYAELREAANCYAAERYTACVFHAMRAVEIGLRALGDDLGVAFPDKPIELAEWQNIIEQVESKIKERVNRRAGDKDQAKERDEDRKFYSQVASQFRYFKDGWRIRAAHARETFTGSQGLSVLGRAAEFFEDLATRLAEPL